MTANEIIPGLWIGDSQDAEKFQGIRICVHEAGCNHGCFQGPILKQVLVPEIRASVLQLNSLAEFIDRQMKKNEGPVLVHCGAGIERSPLTVTWYLQSKQKMSLEEAWQLVSKNRPQAQDRRVWLG